MFRTSLAYTTLSFAVLAGGFVACSSSTPDPVIEQASKQPPPRPEGGIAGDGDGVVLAINTIELGLKDGWKTIGYDLDNRVSTKASTDLCKTNAGGTKSQVYEDGKDGIDNSFGKNLAPLLDQLASAQASLDTSLEEGTFTIMVDIAALGTAPDYLDLTAKLYAGDDLGSPPLWDGTDAWPVVPELLDDPTDISSAKVQFKTSYVNDGVWVSGSPGSLGLGLSISGASFTIDISQAIISMNLAADRQSATEGVIAGVIEVEPFIAQLKSVAGSIDSGLCEGGLFDTIADTLRQASDIMADGSQDPNQTCDAISIGLGFTAQAVTLGEIAEPAVPEPDPCAETSGAGGAGAGGGGTGGGGTGGGTGGGGTGGAGGG